jgi:polysaccharide deacetylase family protein (PEP-CTERM system associated)
MTSSCDSAPTITVPALRPPADGQPLIAFTIDVEDWYQSCVDFDAPITSRVVRNTERVLEVLDEHCIKATFFVQGRVAETFPALVRRIIAEGHEVQSHGFSHRPLHRMSRWDLRNELDRARKTVEDAAGAQVTAFRAQDFSVLAGNLWAVDILAAVGFEVDSSIFPMKAGRYGIAGWEVAPHYVETPHHGRILEVPVAIWTMGRWRVPVAGGGYWRLIPASVLVRALRGIVATPRPAIVYCHPYEFNSAELDDYRGTVGSTLRVSQGFGRRSFARRVKTLFEQLPFGRFDQVLKGWGLM